MTLPGLGLGQHAGGVSWIGTKWSGQAEGSPLMLGLAFALPIAISLWLGTGDALYLLGFYAAGTIQGLLMPKDPQPKDPEPKDPEPSGEVPS
jgi:hypothetical protein